jgi:hypothetical protein
VGRWRESTPERAARSGDRIKGGMLAGVLSAEITWFVMKGGIVDEVIRWMHRHKFQRGEVLELWGELLEFSIATGVVGVLLGLLGAVLAMFLDRFRRQGRPTQALKD